MKRSFDFRFFWSVLLAGFTWGSCTSLLVQAASAREIVSNQSSVPVDIAQVIFFGEDSIELREQFQQIEQPPQRSQPEIDTPTQPDSPDSPTDSQTPTLSPQPVGTPENGGIDDGSIDDGGFDDGGFDDGSIDDGGLDDGSIDNGGLDDGTIRIQIEQEGFNRYFLADALNGVADPFSGRGSSVTRIQSAEGQILSFLDASDIDGLQTIEGTLSLNINSSLQTAIDNGDLANFLGSGGSLSITGSDGTVTNLSVSRTSFNSATLSIGDTTIGITVNDFDGQGATIIGDPLTGLAQLSAGTAGTITLNGQAAIIRAGLTGNDGVIQFVGDNGETFQIRVDDVTSVTQEQLDNLTLDSTTSGGLTFGTIPDR